MKWICTYLYVNINKKIHFLCVLSKTPFSISGNLKKNTSAMLEITMLSANSKKSKIKVFSMSFWCFSLVSGSTISHLVFVTNGKRHLFNLAMAGQKVLLCLNWFLVKFKTKFRSSLLCINTFCYNDTFSLSISLSSYICR